MSLLSKCSDKNNKMSKSDKLGNPAAIVATEAAFKAAGNKQVQAVAKNTFLVIALGVGGYFGYKAYQKWRVKQYLVKNGNEPHVIAALRMYKAMFSDWTIPIGIFSITLPDGTTEEMLYKIAREFGDLKEISTAYNKIFNKALMLDIQSELSADEFETFKANLDSSGVATDIQNTEFEDIKPYQVGETVYANRPNIIVNKSIYKNNTYTKGDVYKKYAFAEKIGTIKLVLKNTDLKRVTYLIDIPWDVWDDGLVDHKDVINNQP